MPVLKIKQVDGTWREVWGATIDPNIVLPKKTTVTVFADAWEGSDDLYYQNVICDGVSANSKIEPNITPSQAVELKNCQTSIMFTNNGAVVTAWAVGNKPTSDMTIAVSIVATTV